MLTVVLGLAAQSKELYHMCLFGDNLAFPPKKTDKTRQQDTHRVLLMCQLCDQSINVAASSRCLSSQSLHGFAMPAALLQNRHALEQGGGGLTLLLANRAPKHILCQGASEFFLGKKSQQSGVMSGSLTQRPQPQQNTPRYLQLTQLPISPFPLQTTEEKILTQISPQMSWIVLS